MGLRGEADMKQTGIGREFSFNSRHFDASSGQLTLNYSNTEYGDFTEVFQFPQVDMDRYQQLKPHIDAAMDCLYWMAGVSYYKTSLAETIQFGKHNKGQVPNQRQADWLTQTWQHGLAELAFENHLPWLQHIKFFHAPDAKVNQSKTVDLSARSLVAIGGGKDSLVSIEAIKSMGEEATLFMVGQSAFIQSVATKTGLPLLQIKRKVDSKLKQVNAAGAFNGHVPITAINACVAVVSALLYDFDAVVFSNERSADSGNVQLEGGQWVNHQYSKSLAYEQTWQQIIQQDIARDLLCFSLLRPFSEVAIVQKFAALKTYFPYFSSCNRNFHLSGTENQNHHWCGSCPKCAFVFLCLAPFISRKELMDIFKKDLLADDELITLFESLLGIKGLKPFECVGEQQECRLAVQLLASHPDWHNQQQINQWLQVLPELNQAQIDTLMTASQAHMIPNKRKFQQVLDHAP